MQTNKPKSGQVAIMLMLILLLLATITTAAVAIGVSSLRDTTTYNLGDEALTIAQSGADNAILRLLRDPSYSGEVGLPIGDGNATIVVTGTTPKTITVTATLGQMVRRVEVIASIVSGQLTITSRRVF